MKTCMGMCEGRREGIFQQEDHSLANWAFQIQICLNIVGPKPEILVVLLSGN